MKIFEQQTILASAFGPSGREELLSNAIEKMAAPYADEITRDVLGNLIVHKKGKGKRVMFSAHMDSIGMIVTHIDKEGFLRFSNIGWLDPPLILGTRVVFENGTRGLVCSDGKFEQKNMRLTDMYIDIGASDGEEARKSVSVGDMAVYDQHVGMQGDILFSPYLDDRIACVVLLKALETIKKPLNDLFFVFTVQEEVGIRGAKTAAFGVEPEFAFAADVTMVGDTPEWKPKNDCRIGGGAAIKLMDASVIAHPRVVRYLEDAAVKHGVRVQREILRGGGTDAGAIHQSRAGVYTGGISIPARYTHNPIEMCSMKDVEECVKLAVLAAEIEL